MREHHVDWSEAEAAHADPERVRDPGKHTLTERMTSAYPTAASPPLVTAVGAPPAWALVVQPKFQAGGSGLQRVAIDGGAGAAGPAPSGAGVDDGPGAPLPSQLRGKMEQAFAAPLDDVRVHVGPEADSLGALAFARGNEVHFAPGHYDQGSEAGQALLGHELTHVLQQRAGRVTGSQGKGDGNGAGGAAISDDPGLEAEADQLGARAARGESAAVPGVPAEARPVGRFIQRVLRTTPTDQAAFVHQYDRVDGRGVQAPSGQYQHWGNGVFFAVQKDKQGQWVRIDANTPYFHKASAGALFPAVAGVRHGGGPIAFMAPAEAKGGSGGPVGRADDDERKLAIGVKDQSGLELAKEIATQLGVPVITAFSGWSLVPTFPDSPVQLFIQCKPEEVTTWTGRAGGQQSAAEIWSSLNIDAGRLKDSGDHEASSHGSSRSTRPTDRDFRTPATTAFTGKPNPKDRILFEFCHLIGDGDGGSNAKENLSVGSRASNTEQLVLETVQRHYSKFLKKHGFVLVLRGQASLIQGGNTDKWQHDHTADWMRYEISIRDKSGKLYKILDHVIDGHRDRISKTMVRVMLAQAHALMGGLLEEILGARPSTGKKPKKPKKAAVSSTSAAAVDDTIGDDNDDWATQLGVLRELQALSIFGQLDDAAIERLVKSGYNKDALATALGMMEGDTQAQGHLAADGSGSSENKHGFSIGGDIAADPATYFQARWRDFEQQFLDGLTQLGDMDNSKLEDAFRGLWQQVANSFSSHCAVYKVGPDKETAKTEAAKAALGRIFQQCLQHKDRFLANRQAQQQQAYEQKHGTPAQPAVAMNLVTSTNQQSQAVAMNTNQAPADDHASGARQSGTDDEWPEDDGEWPQEAPTVGGGDTEDGALSDSDDDMHGGAADSDKMRTR